jgi:hypothetical protein
VSGSNLFVTSFGKIGEYTTSGATVNASLITTVSTPQGIALSGGNLFVTDWSTGTIGEFTTLGVTVNASLISVAPGPADIAVSGSNLFVSNIGTYDGTTYVPNSGTIGEYTISGAVVNASLITGVNYPYGIAIVPEPSTLALLALGVGAWLFVRRRWALRMNNSTVVAAVVAVTALWVVPTTAHGQFFVASSFGGSAFNSVIDELDSSGGTLVAPLIFRPDTVLSVNVAGSNLFVSSENLTTTNTSWTISEYTTAGATVNASLISGTGPAPGILVSGSDLFVMSSQGISKYTTSGALVTQSLIPGLSGSFDAAVSGGNLFLLSGSNGTIAEYSTSGAMLNPSLITGLVDPAGIAISGSNLFVLENLGAGGAAIAKYTTSGATVNASLITGLGAPVHIVAHGEDLFVITTPPFIFNNPYVGSISEYTTSGALINPTLVGGLAGAVALAVIPEPSTLALGILGALSLMGFGRRLRSRCSCANQE